MPGVAPAGPVPQMSQPGSAAGAAQPSPVLSRTWLLRAPAGNGLRASCALELQDHLQMEKLRTVLFLHLFRTSLAAACVHHLSLYLLLCKHLPRAEVGSKKPWQSHLFCKNEWAAPASLHTRCAPAPAPWIHCRILSQSCHTKWNHSPCNPLPASESECLEKV